ncbi:Na+/H+ antiporter subunit D [Vibrio sp. JPW-9-11-11]|uniref:proton-conducting transporter transmembrane domain-containing protein n=1 Tax=Vibrio sp. JPW-9-11-11 TaxID=1416532 RepID=UPI0015944FC9|nr:proton-conducting transporter membrane subunit [Vibrio sp. JPW-9-11-11]NVD08674.1 Na+/H+ antiporter subunit D [Vibrio sp. JPW-9-11-11]
MSGLLLTLPVVVALSSALLLYTLRSQARLVEWVSVVSALAQLVVTLFLMNQVIVSGVQVVAFGEWAAPFGIVFVADHLSAAMVVVTAVIGVAAVIYAIADLVKQTSYGLYHSYFHILLAGIYGAFLTGDVFNLYVWFEVMLIASFALMVLDADKTQIDGAVKYVVLNLISTLTLLLAIGLLYGATGTLNLADLHGKLPLVSVDMQRMLAALFLFAFAIKAALFPLFAWLPASYHTLPSGVLALFAALLTKVGVYALMRMFSLVFPLPDMGLQPLLIGVAGLTMLTGVLGAASQFDVKKVLSFHIISQIGYMLMGLALYTPVALAGAIFYIIHHIIVKANLFLIGGLLERKMGSSHLSRLGGAYQTMPGLALLFIIPAFSLAGFPPLSGFWGKFLVIKSSIEQQHYLLAATALVVGLLTVFSMSKIWAESFWKPAPADCEPQQTVPRQWGYYLPIITLTALSVIIGLAAEPFYLFAQHAAAQLMDSTDYVTAVLGEVR